MVIEWLKIKVSPELREKYIQKDEEIWSTALSRYSGFLGKQVWINPRQQDEVVLVIYWESRDAWNGVSAKHMEETEQRFLKEMGEGTYQIIEEGEYQVRKFPQPSSSQ
ncbi:MAG: TIGR03792 family protein [Leptolyngbyaceae cyanobacterium HOT.MB2.61]|nr:TIGR03792 family protein [Leptolyngbyaceae cyanobacterium HOT.MB2.61]